MKTQPEALRLADWLDGAYEGDAQDAAAKLRDQHALIVELRQALWDATVIFEPEDGKEHDAPAWLKRAQAALAKAEAMQ